MTTQPHRHRRIAIHSIILAITAIAGAILFFSSCATHKRGCPATWKMSGYHQNR